MAAAGELRCADSAIESVLEDIDSAFIWKEEQRNAIKAFVDRNMFLPSFLWDSVKVNILRCSDGCRSIQLSEGVQLKHAP